MAVHAQATAENQNQVVAAPDGGELFLRRVRREVEILATRVAGSPDGECVRVDRIAPEGAFRAGLVTGRRGTDYAARGEWVVFDPVTMEAL